MAGAVSGRAAVHIRHCAYDIVPTWTTWVATSKARLQWCVLVKECHLLWWWATVAGHYCTSSPTCVRHESCTLSAQLLRVCTNPRYCLDCGRRLSFRRLHRTQSAQQSVLYNRALLSSVGGSVKIPGCCHWHLLRSRTSYLSASIAARISEGE